MTARTAETKRTSFETDVLVRICLDGQGQAKIASGIPFLDHLLTALTKHSRFDLELSCKGDLEVDDHHTAEDCAIAIGTAIDRALGERRGIRRFGSAYAPLDEALARSVVDLSGRPFAEVQLHLAREMLGGIACENIEHVINSMAIAARACFHVDVLKGKNDHHRAEAAMKSLALALRQAVALDGVSSDVPSTKGKLT